MEIYNTFNKQHHTLYQLFLDKGKILIVSIMFIVSTIMIWYHWYKHNNTTMVAASSTWQSINIGLSGQATQAQLDTAQYFSNTNHNNYGALASMGLAKQFVAYGDFLSAQKQLQKALSQTSEVNLQSLIKIRLARVQLQQKNVDGALKTINSIKEYGWKALAEDARGDVQIIKGNIQAARIAYEKALQSNIQLALVQMKVNNLSS